MEISKPGFKDRIVGRLENLKQNQHALICVVDQGVVSVAGFATSILIGRHAPSELGVYYIALSIVLFIKGIQHQMLCIPYTIYQHQHSDQRLHQYRGSCLVQYAGLMVLTMLFLAIQTSVVASGRGWLQVDTEMVPSLCVLLALIPVLMLREITRHCCFTHFQNVSALIIDSSISVLQIGLLFVLGLLGCLSGAIAWALIGILSLAVVAVWQFRSGFEIAIDGQSVREDWKQNWSFGKWAVAGQLVGSLPTFLLPWIIAAAVGTKETGYFAAGMSLIGLANIFNMGMANFLTPKATQVYVDQGAPGLSKMVIKMVALFLAVMGSLIIMTYLLGGWIAEELYGPDYAGLGMLMTVLATAKLFESMVMISSTGLFVMEKIKANFYVDICLMVVTLTAAVVLIFPFGILGAAWTAAVGAIVSAILRGGLLVHFLVKLSKQESAA